MMNNSKKLALSKETLRSLDDDDLTDVVGGGGGGGRKQHGGGGHNNNNSFGCSGICVSYECNSGICSGLLCIA
jgi:hypothetical protein